MEIIKSPLMNLLALSIISALIIYFCNATKFQKSVKMLCALLMLVSIFNILSPILSLIGKVTFENTNETVEDDSIVYDDAVIKQSADYISKYTEDLICNCFNVNKNDVSVSVTLDKGEDDNVIIKNVTVKFSNKLDLSGLEVASLVNNTLLCECIVLTDGEKE